MRARVIQPPGRGRENADATSAASQTRQDAPEERTQPPRKEDDRAGLPAGA